MSLRFRRLIKRMQKAIDRHLGITLSSSELRLLNIYATQEWYDHYQENDSPKGENIPGVRYESE